MATFVLSEASSSLRRVPLFRIVGSVLVQGSMSHHIHTRLPYTRSYKAFTCPFSLS